MILTPKITVIMAVFNMEKYVVATVESILAQTFTDFELIAIDDGSIDNTLMILKSFADDRMRIVEQLLQSWHCRNQLA